MVKYFGGGFEVERLAVWVKPQRMLARAWLWQQLGVAL